MATNRVNNVLLLVVGVFLVAAGTSRAASDPVPEAGSELTLVEKKFQQAAKHYQKYQHEGQVVYCKKEKAITSAIPGMQCITEAGLRLQVEQSIKRNNMSVRPVVAGSGQGGIG